MIAASGDEARQKAGGGDQQEHAEGDFEGAFRQGMGDGRKRVLVTGVLCSAVTALLGAGLYFSHGIPERFPAPIRAVAMAAFDENPDSNACHNHKAAQVDADDVCMIGRGGKFIK